MSEVKTEVVVIGGGPGGYSAAFRAADLGLDVTIVERFGNIGGVCLNVGCIPSKTYLHIAKVIKESVEVGHSGIKFSKPELDLKELLAKKNRVVGQLVNGLHGMAKQRKVRIVQGYAKFEDKNTLNVEGNDEVKTIKFDKCIIAAGSRVREVPGFDMKDKRIWDSTDALEVSFVPKKLLVVGGGIISLEMATVYKNLGSEVDIAVRGTQVISSIDMDMVNTYLKAVKDDFNIMLKTKVKDVDSSNDGTIKVTLDNEGKDLNNEYDAILLAVGRVPNGDRLDCEKAGVKVDGGFIPADNQLKTNVDNIWAIGDIIGQPMLAHKAVNEGHVAAEVISGQKHFFEPVAIPSVAYTLPEIAFVGLNEDEAKEKGIEVEVAKVPWSAIGRAIASDADAGATKLLFDKKTHKLVGAQLVGDNAGELLGELTLALEMDCVAEDIALTIHAHPTLYESIAIASEIYEGSVTDFPNKKAVKK